MADPLAGGSSFASCEPKMEYDEELDFLSPNFNPERALYSPDVSVPCPEIKLFESVKHYEDAIKSRSKQTSKNRSKKDKGTSVDKPDAKLQESSVDIDKTVIQNTDIKASPSDSSPSLDKPLASATCIEKQKRVERQGKLLTYASAASGSGTYASAASGSGRVVGQDGSCRSVGQSEEQALDLADTSRLQKTPAVTVQKKFPLQVQIPKFDVKDSSDASRSSRQKSTKVRNVFTRMENMAGPLRVLTRCVQEHLQIRVMTRGAVTVKSICRGYVVAFDKHFNIALIDVDEIYRRPAVLGKIKS
ncbi:unnamed protein product, partial [Candidula unifasciata]